MNDTMEYDEARETAGLLDSDGRIISETTRTTNDVLTRMDKFIRAEPVKTAIIAMAIGYVIGRLRLIV